MIQQTYSSRRYRIVEVTKSDTANRIEAYHTKAAALTAAAALLAQYPEIVRVKLYFQWELNGHAGSCLAEEMTRRSTTYREHHPARSVSTLALPNQPAGANNE